MQTTGSNGVLGFVEDIHGGWKEAWIRAKLANWFQPTSSWISEDGCRFDSPFVVAAP